MKIIKNYFVYVFIFSIHYFLYSQNKENITRKIGKQKNTLGARRIDKYNNTTKKKQIFPTPKKKKLKIIVENRFNNIQKWKVFNENTYKVFP